MSDLWTGLKRGAQSALVGREYRSGELAQRLGSTGVEVSELLGGNRAALGWIPGVEFFPRKVYPQRHRGFFAEFARRDEGLLAQIGLWPAQWATARMFAGTAKGFHVHPPHIPEGENAEGWFQKLFGAEGASVALRPYEREQWDVMFFIQGNMEMLLVDERAGLPRRVMRFLIEGDDMPGPNNAGVVIPAGVAHALRVEGSRDVIMVYGTSTRFHPEFEGRIAHGVETATVPPEWERYLDRERD
jgi:dTDP-4-dehydrorhamnose 3,5-epimerase-like enzyme